MDFDEVEGKISEEIGFSQRQENARKSEEVSDGKKGEEDSKRFAFAIQNSSSSDIRSADSNSNSNSNSNGDHEYSATANDRFPVLDPDFPDTSLDDPEASVTHHRNPMTDIAEDRTVQPILQPHPQLPKPEPPPGLGVSPNELVQRSRFSPENFSVDMRKFIRESGNAITKRLSSLQENHGRVGDSNAEVTEFKIPGLKIFVKLKSEEEIRGRITLFSRSNCRDCSAVRSFFRQEGLDFVEINIDVFPVREKELIDRTGSSQVPQIFFNEKLFGGLVALNSLRNSGEFDRRVKEMLAEKCSAEAPVPPLYGFDDEDNKETTADEMIGFVRVLRQRLPIQDRLMKMKIVRNCFSGGEMVEVLINHLDCGRKKAIDIGRKLAKKHFIHHVLGQNGFEDGNHYYRFLEHEPFIPKCYNFRGTTNDDEPQFAAIVGQKLNKIMSAILESYASDDRCHVDYLGIGGSEEFRRYLNMTQELQRVNLLELSADEKLAFFLNLYNAMAIHALIRIGPPEGVMDRRSFASDFQYIVGGYSYSLSTIRNGILRGNRRPSFALIRPFANGDPRLELALQKLNPLVHFGLCDGTKSSPSVRFFTSQGVEAELRRATREFFQNGGIDIVLDKRIVYLTRIIKWYNSDFGREREMLKWMISHLDANKAGLLMHLLGDGGPVNIVYRDYDWSINV